MKRSRPSVRTRRNKLAPVRYLYRLPLLLIHFFIGIFIGLVIVGPRRFMVAHEGKEPFPHRAIRWWATVLIRIVGLRVHPVGEPQPDAALFVCNHTSWLDIELMYTQRAVCFVSKQEIARWPLIGWMATCGGTIYHQRGSSQSLGKVMQTMTKRLESGRSVAVFPEGGTSRNGKLRTFHARIFQAALDANVPVQPVALYFVRNGERWTDIAFREKESFLANVLRLLGAPTSDAEIHFLPVVPPHPKGRKHMAEQARDEIAKALNSQPAMNR